MFDDQQAGRGSGPDFFRNRLDIPQTQSVTGLNRRQASRKGSFHASPPAGSACVQQALDDRPKLGRLGRTEPRHLHRRDLARLILTYELQVEQADGPRVRSALQRI